MRAGKPSVCIGCCFFLSSCTCFWVVHPADTWTGRERQSWQPLGSAWPRLRKNDCDQSYAFQSLQLAPFQGCLRKVIKRTGQKPISLSLGKRRSEAQQLHSPHNEGTAGLPEEAHQRTQTGCRCLCHLLFLCFFLQNAFLHLQKWGQGQLLSLGFHHGKVYRNFHDTSGETG